MLRDGSEFEAFDTSMEKLASIVNCALGVIELKAHRFIGGWINGRRRQLSRGSAWGRVRKSSFLKKYLISMSAISYHYFSCNNGHEPKANVNSKVDVRYDF